MKAKKPKESQTKKIKKNQQKFKLDMTFEDAIAKIVKVPPKNKLNSNMFYYSVSYKTLPLKLPSYLPQGVTEYENFFLFGHTSKLNEEQIRYATETYLKNNNEDYEQLIINSSKEISEQEYISQTQYN